MTIFTQPDAGLSLCQIVLYVVVWFLPDFVISCEQFVLYVVDVVVDDVT